MYFLKIMLGSLLVIDGETYHFQSGGADDDGTFVGTFVNENGFGIEVSTPKGGAIAIEDTILNFIHFFTRRNR